MTLYIKVCKKTEILSNVTSHGHNPSFSFQNISVSDVSHTWVKIGQAWFLIKKNVLNINIFKVLSFYHKFTFCLEFQAEKIQKILVYKYAIHV